MDNRIEIRPNRIINVTLYHHPSSTTTAFLIHGLGARSQQWREQIKFLKEKYSLVVPDLLGHGKSDKPFAKTANPYSFFEFTQDLHALFNQFATNDNIILGHSYGGALATMLACNHQEKVSQLILVCPLPCAPMHKIPYVYYLPIFMLELLRPLLEKQFFHLAFDASANPELIREETQASRKNPMYMLKSMIMGMKDIPQLDLTQLHIPTFMVLGEHDKIVPPLVSQQFYQTLPYLKSETISHAAHMVMLEKSESVNASINRFLPSQEIQF